MNNRPPRMIDHAQVIMYSPLDHRHRPTGACRHTIPHGGQVRFAGLAICQYEQHNDCYLFYCDQQWKVLTDTLHMTLDAAIQQAEAEFEGIAATWIKLNPRLQPISKPG